MGETIDFKTKLNAVDITDHIDLGSSPIPEITSALNEQLDTLTIKVKDGDALDIHDWQEIQVLDGTEPVFGGYVLTPDREAGTDLTKNDYPLGASDYAAYFEKVFVQKEFVDKTDAEIIAEVFADSADLAGFDGTTYVTAIQTIPRVVFNRKSVREVLNWLANQSGGYWYCDYEKKLHYFGVSEFRAPFDITNDPLDAAKKLAEGVKVDVNGAGVVNVVEVVGGNALSADTTFPFTRVGYSTDLFLNKRLAPWAAESKIIVRRNDGGPTTNLLANPSFEVNITDGWTQSQEGSGAAWAQDATKFSQGTKSAKITAGTGISKLLSANISLAPGEALSVQAMAFTATLGMGSVVIYDTSNLVVLAETVSRKTSTWERLTATFINETSASMTLRLELRNKATDSALAVYFDAAQAEKLAWPSAYCDGSLGTGYAWSGTANNSTSTRVNMPVWRTLTVKTGNNDTLEGRDEVLYYESESKLEQETYWPTLSDAIEVDGREETPVRVVVRNYASYSHYGKWFKKVIFDTAIIDTEVARMRAATILAQDAYASETISFTVHEAGLRAGQTQNVYLPQRGVNGDYLIKSVKTSISVGGYVTSKVELGAADAGLVSLLLKLKLATSTTNLSNDELMDQVLDFKDSFTVSDDDVLITGTSGPYLWDVAKWDYSKYGEE
jgi:hypothetical protein